MELKQVSEGGVEENTSASASHLEHTKLCPLCKSMFATNQFVPFCSLKCARRGIVKRNELLRKFISFERKYIAPEVKKVETTEIAVAKDPEETAENKEAKTSKRYPVAKYSQYVTMARQKSRTLLLEKLSKPFKTEIDLSKINFTDLACRIEESLYGIYPYLQDYGLKEEYNSKLRDLIFNLSDPKNIELRLLLFTDEVEPERLPHMTSVEMASTEMRKYKEEEERRHLEENVLIVNTTQEKKEESLPVEKKVESVEPVEPMESVEPMAAPSKEEVMEKERRIAAMLSELGSVVLEKASEAPTTSDAPDASNAPDAPEAPDALEASDAPKEEESMIRTVSLCLLPKSESHLGIGMPEEQKLHFRATVIQASEEVEVEDVLIEEELGVIGRMEVGNCEKYWESKRNHMMYDEIWWLLELEGETDEKSLEQLLGRFTVDKRVGVLETYSGEKSLYFVPPALDPSTASPITTLSFVSNGCYKQFCHLLFLHKRQSPKERKARREPVPSPSSRPPQVPQPPYSSPPYSSPPQASQASQPPYSSPPQASTTYSPSQPSVYSARPPYPYGGYPPPTYGYPPRGDPRNDPRGYPPPPRGTPRGYPPRGYPPRPREAYPPRYDPYRGARPPYPPQGYPPPRYLPYPRPPPNNTNTTTRSSRWDQK